MLRPPAVASAIAVALAALLPLCLPTAADAAPSSISLDADRVTYFSNRFIVAGDGHVRVRLGDGTELHGETFSMDLKLNRYIVAGNVTVDSQSTHLAGAAYSGFVDFDRAYFIPIIEEPDRWTFIGDDFTHPLKGREMPGDAFALPDLTTSRPFVISRSAFIIPGQNVQFTAAQVATGPIYTPFPAYDLNFSQNPNFRQNAFAGAYIDVPIPFQGSSHNLTSAHVRYDSLSHLYLSFDEHFVWNRDYIVLSLNPATSYQKAYAFLGNKRLSPNVELRDFTQFLNLQHGFQRPQASAQFTDVQFTAALRHSFIRINGDFYNNEVIGPPRFLAQAQHPTNTTLSWVGFQNRVLNTPVQFQLQTGFSYAHDAYGVGSFNGTAYQSTYGKFAQLQLYTPSQKIANGIYANATYIKQLQFFSQPHYFNNDNTTVSLSFLPPRAKLATFISYNVVKTGDYAGAQQSAIYPSTIVTGPQDGIIYTSFAAFHGVATQHNLTLSSVFTPNPNFALNVTARKSRDFPEPIPGYYGQSPYQVSVDVRVRLAPQVLLDVQRAYYFNFGTLRYSPQFGIQFAP